MPYLLRHYQIAAADAAMLAMMKGSPEIVAIPTGGGKSIVIAEIVRQLCPSPKRRVLIVTHSQEIVEQDVRAIQHHTPDSKIGVICAGLGELNRAPSINIATVQSIWRGERYLPYHSVIIDECHLIGRKDASMYRRLLKTLRAANPKIKIIGFSATPYRLDSGYLHEGPDALFSAIFYEAPLPELIRHGVLCPLVSAPQKGLDAEKLRVARGDFDVSAYTNTESWRADTESAVDAFVASSKDRKRLLMFCCTVKHADAIAEMLARRGVHAASVHTKTGATQRKEILRAFRDGRLRALVNVNMLTTGLDVPEIDCIGVFRPTLSTGLYVQMVGRGMRTAKDKKDCLLLDFGANIERHGALLDIIPSIAKPIKMGGGVPAIKECKGCKEEIAAWGRQCPHCGYLTADIKIVPSAINPMSTVGSSPKPGERGGPKANNATWANKGNSVKVYGLKSAPPSRAAYLSSQEVGDIIGVSALYIRQMRNAGTGPEFYNSGGHTFHGWREVIYRIEDVEQWQNERDPKNPNYRKRLKVPA